LVRWSAWQRIAVLSRPRICAVVPVWSICAHAMEVSCLGRFRLTANGA
jgi:hypothetical protein